MKKNTLLFTAAIAGVVLMAGCLKQEDPIDAVQLNLPSETFNYSDSSAFPVHMMNEFQFNAPGVFNNNQGGFINDEVFFFDEFGNFASAPNNPKVTNEGATLGRVLFYDTKLSINNTIACASCHKQEFAFADPTAGSKGFGGKITPRNSMAIVNVALNRNLFWDSRVQSAKQLTLKPVQNHIEMGMENLDALVKKLSNTPYYAELFTKAFGDSHVTEERISDAMAQFLCSMISVNSRFDNSLQTNNSDFNDLEKAGKALFFSERTKCAKCHSGNNFAADDRPGGEYGGGGTTGNPKGTANNGLELVSTDAGMKDGQFRIPSLRNVELTGPYMHDGRFKTLEEVVEFYNSGVKLHANLDKKLVGADGEPLRLNLSEIEKKALVAFLKTLTDENLPKDPKFSNPFN